MNEDVDWSPGGKVEETGKIALERRDTAARKQQQRKNDRKQRVEHDRQHHVQHRNPDQPLLGRGGHGVAGLGISALEREGIAVGIAEVELGGLESIDHALLLEELVAGHGAAGEQLRDHRNIGGELCTGGGLGKLGVHRMREWQRIGIDLGVPLRIDQAPSLCAGLALDIDRPATGIGQILHAAVGGGTHPKVGPEIGRLAEQLQALGAEQDVVIGALLEVAVQVGLEHGIADLEPAHLVPHPRTVDEAAIGIVQGRRHDEHRLGSAGEVVAYLTGERGHDAEPDRHIGDS